MKQLKNPKKEEEGFTLVELIVVCVIMAILSQIGLVSFNRYTRRTRAFAARTAIRNIKSECEMNRDLGMDAIFTPLKPRGYSLQSRRTNSCLGQAGSGLVSAIPDNQGEYPSYFYNFQEGKISCEYSSPTDNLFKDCLSLKSKLERNDFVVKDTYIERGCSAYAVVEGKNWDEAQANSRKVGGHLATINNKEESDWVVKNLKWLQPKDPNYGAYGWNDGSGGRGGGKEIAYWIGLREKPGRELSNQHRLSKEEQIKNLEWADGTPVESTYMHQGRSDGNVADENFFGLVNTGHFNDMADPTIGSGDHRTWYQMEYGIVEIPTCNS